MSHVHYNPDGTPIACDVDGTIVDVDTVERTEGGVVITSEVSNMLVINDHLGKPIGRICHAHYNVLIEMIRLFEAGNLPL